MTVGSALLTVLVTDIRGSTAILTQAPDMIVRRFIGDFTDVTRRALLSATGAAAAFDINSFTGDGFLTFIVESEAALSPAGPDQAIRAALAMQHSFRSLCAGRRFAPYGFNALALVAGITHGPVLYGPFTKATLRRSTGMTSNVSFAFRLAQFAEPGQILLADGLEAHTKQALKTIEMGIVKGFEYLGPLRCFEVV